MSSSVDCSLNEAITFGIVIIFLVLYKLRSNGRKVKLPPGPRPWPVIGNLHLLGNLPHQAFATLAKQYGPIFSLRLGSVPTVVVSSPAMAKEFLKTHNSVFANRAVCAHGKFACYNRQDVVFGHYGPYWRHLRKLCTVELLTAKRNESFRFVREEEVSAMVASIWKESEGGEKCVDMKKRLSSLSQNIICRMFASRTYSDDELNAEQGFKDMVNEVFAVAGAFCLGDFIPFLDWLDFQGIHRRMEAVHKQLDGFAEKVIDEHIDGRLRKGDPNEVDRVEDMVDMLLDMAETEGQIISRVHIKCIITDMLSAGTETSSTLLEWAMSELLRNPAMCARAQQEIESAVGRDRTVKDSDVVKFNYLRCVVKETFRLHPPLPLLIPHESMEGCNVEGYFIPPKTRLFVNVWAMGRDENIWKDAQQFKSERFIGSNKDVKGQDFDLLPFGTGRRGYPGISSGLSTIGWHLLSCFIALIGQWRVTWTWRKSLDWLFPGKIHSLPVFHGGSLLNILFKKLLYMLLVTFFHRLDLFSELGIMRLSWLVFMYLSSGF